MRESLLTIPINEILEPLCGCPICRMRNMLEQRTLEYIMGAAMMEPDVRIETNKTGFCHTHFSMMAERKNRLSLALMLQSHLEHLEENLFSKKKLFEAKDSRKNKLSTINESCFVCDKIELGMNMFMKTLFEMFSKDENTRELFLKQEYICLPHYEMLSNTAPNYLSKKEISRFNEAVTSLAKNYITELHSDVSKYCSMYDYRNTGKDADWGNSKDSIERAILFLTSRET